MNKTLLQFKIVLVSTISIIVVTILTITLNEQVQAQTIIDTSAATGINTTINTTSDVNSVNLRNRIKAEMDAKIQNIKTNQEIRNQMLERNKLASTSTRASLPQKMPPNQPKILVPQNAENQKKIRDQGENQYYYKVNQDVPNQVGSQYYYRNEQDLEKRLENRPSSTSPQFRKEGYENNGKAMMAKLLKEKKDAVHKQLNVAMQNLVELRKRISSRVEKDRMNGKDLGAISELIKIADSKIALAKEAIAKLRSYEPTPTNTMNVGTTTTAINLDQVRELIDNAQKSIKEAHRALTDVVVAIAKISGTNKGQVGSSTPITNTVSPSPSPTSTPSTTNQ